uniref:CHCH domain-containing protein n=1 Tax=Rhabditophanes sp. KR3021 TaxID=114890 RepID=A0AC35TRB0_9BILA
MVRRRSSPVSSGPVRRSSPAPAASPRPASTPAHAAPPMGGAAPKQPGLMAQMAATAGGVAIGSAVGHAMGGMFSGGSSSAPAEQASAQAPVNNGQQNYQNACEFEYRQFFECSRNSADINACSAYHDLFKECRSRNPINLASGSKGQTAHFDNHMRSGCWVMVGMHVKVMFDTKNGRKGPKVERLGLISDFDVDCVKVQFEDDHSVETHNNENILPVPPKRNEPCRFVFGDYFKTKGIVKDIQWDQKEYLVLSKRIGSDVFVLGGGVNKKIEKYNLESNKSEVLSFEMSCNNEDYSTVVYSNRIYVIGGELNGDAIDTVEYFEPEKMKWIDAPKLLQQVSYHDSVIVDQIIYAVGNRNSNKFQRIDPREGKWSFLADMPNQTYWTALSVFGHAFTCAGGVKTESLCQIYDIRNDKWDKLANLTIPVWGAKSIENETSIIIVGGYNTDQIQSYSKYNKTWSIMDIKLPHTNDCSSKIWL